MFETTVPGPEQSYMWQVMGHSPAWGREGLYGKDGPRQVISSALHALVPIFS